MNHRLFSIQFLEDVYGNQDSIKLPSTCKVLAEITRKSFLGWQEVLGRLKLRILMAGWLLVSRAESRVFYVVGSTLASSHCCPMNSCFQRSFPTNKSHLLIKIKNISYCQSALLFMLSCHDSS